MLYISTRGNHSSISSATAISLGMVPDGGLFVPQSVPRLPQLDASLSYQDMARKLLSVYLSDFSETEIDYCVENAYNRRIFDTDSIIDLVPLDSGLSVMELWHGPTAAFKDVALQIMPYFLNIAKKKSGNNSHTVILVATSGDTGKAALEGFKNCDGISIVVFYPHEGVSEIQRLQMATTDGRNTFVIAVKGNFDDCQTGVKQIFSDPRLRSVLNGRGFELSSANSINWGRLCPQIVYYVKSYYMLVKQKKIAPGEKVDFCVPTGNFGNILAGYYAREMGLPIGKLICASNRNNILSDFLTTGIYNVNREFYRTISPSMDILISSNLERFLFEITGHDASKVCSWYDSLSGSGNFQIDRETKAAIDSMVISGWVDEEQILSTIKSVFRETGYVLDTHTAVGAALCRRLGSTGRHTVIASTASPYKFSCDVLSGIERSTCEDEFESIDRIASLSGMPVHRAVDRLRERPVFHEKVIEVNDMKDSVVDLINSIESRDNQ